MAIFDWIAAAIVIVTIIYIGFVQTVGGWIIALRKGQAVTILPERAGRKWPLWIYTSILIFEFALLVLFFYFGWIPLFTLSHVTARVLGIIGLIIYLLGFVFAEWARQTLGKYWGISTSMQVKLLDNHQLIQSGPYAFVRHPMYFGAWAPFWD